MLSEIAHVSRALIKLGARPIASFDEGTAEAEIAANLYPSIRDGLLSANAWSFALAQTQLAQLQASPVADYPYAFQLPANFLRAISLGTGGSGRGAAYRIAERRLHARHQAVVLTYIFRPAEADWPAFFDSILIAKLAAEFCIPVTESTTRAELLARQAETEYRRARLIDAQQDTPLAIEGFPLVEARRS